MDWASMKTQFFQAAVAIRDNMMAEATDVTSTGVKRLNFSIGGKPFSAIEQRAGTGSTGAKLKALGHDVVQIRDVDAGQLIGLADLTDNNFIIYGQVGRPPVDISVIEKAVAASGMNISRVSPGNSRVEAGRLDLGRLGSSIPLTNGANARQ